MNLHQDEQAAKTDVNALLLCASCQHALRRCKVTWADLSWLQGFLSIGRPSCSPAAGSSSDTCGMSSSCVKSLRSIVRAAVLLARGWRKSFNRQPSKDNMTIQRNAIEAHWHSHSHSKLTNRNRLCVDDQQTTVKAWLNKTFHRANMFPTNASCIAACNHYHCRIRLASCCPSTAQTRRKNLFLYRSRKQHG